jgi:hypothetical protein
MKLTRFQDVPQFTRFGQWECDFDLDRVWNFIEDQISSGLDVDLNPDFQRAHVWNEKQQIAWLEFILRGGRTSRVLYFNMPGWMGDYKGPFVIVDGKQRLEAIRRFTQGEIPVFGSYFGEYTDKLRVCNTVKIHVNNLKTRAEVLQWYLDFNTGGTVHTDEEIEKVRALLEKERGN